MTIRRVALEFGVTPMALYWHVQNKDELLAAMGQSFFDGIGQRYDPDRSVGRPEYAASSSAHRGVTQASGLGDADPQARFSAARRGRRSPSSPSTCSARAGFDVVEAAEIARLALQIAIMLVTQQPGEELEVAVEERDAVLAEKRAAIRQLPVNRFPRLVEAADALTDCDDVEGLLRVRCRHVRRRRPGPAAPPLTHRARCPAQTDRAVGQNRIDDVR